MKVTTLQSRLGGDGLERTLLRLRRSGRIKVRPILPGPMVAPKSLQRVRARSPESPAELENLARRAPRQAKCFARILQSKSIDKKTLVEEGFGYQQIRALEDRGLVEVYDREVLRDPLANVNETSSEELDLTCDQSRAVEAILSALDMKQFYPALLHGVTGSGKTLVYIRAVAHVLSQDRSAIVLVPEIALAWQMVRRFKAHFGAQVAVMHSQLSAGERYDTWRRLRQGEQRVVIGARSAIFSPVSRLGLIVVDEEHDPSYKQEDIEGRHPLFYHARDLALVRGHKEGGAVILGSATPSLESYQNATAGKYNLLVLPHRVDDRPLPRVEIVDMREEPYQKKTAAIFSRSLRLKMKDRLERGEKIILLQNRRGFAPSVICGSCGEAAQCERCRVSLTYHSRSGPYAGPQLRCHYCDFRTPMLEICPNCASEDLKLEGVGTQKVEEALVEQFPDIRVIRMDLDTTGWKGAHDDLVESFRRGDADLLLGTQMVAKGLDFPDVTLVGVISADTGMHIPDFRAAERTFQLLTQVAGRSGRGKSPGEVVVQTRMPDSPVLKAAAEQRFEAFLELEMDERRAAGFPPFGRLIALRWSGKEEQAVQEIAHSSTLALNRTSAGFALFGPAPAPLARLRGQFRWQTLLRGDSTRLLRDIVGPKLPAMLQAARKKKVAFAVNVDPVAIM